MLASTIATRIQLTRYGESAEDPISFFTNIGPALVAPYPHMCAIVIMTPSMLATPSCLVPHDAANNGHWCRILLPSPCWGQWFDATIHVTPAILRPLLFFLVCVTLLRLTIAITEQFVHVGDPINNGCWSFFAIIGAFDLTSCLDTPYCCPTSSHAANSENQPAINPNSPANMVTRGGEYASTSLAFCQRFDHVSVELLLWTNLVTPIPSA